MFLLINLYEIPSFRIPDTLVIREMNVNFFLLWCGKVSEHCGESLGHC